LTLKFFELEGRFPRHAGELPPAAVSYVARQVAVDPAELRGYDWSGRSAERYHGQIRRLFGFRRFSEDDDVKLAGWLADEVAAVDRRAAAGGAAAPLPRRTHRTAGPSQPHPRRGPGHDRLRGRGDDPGLHPLIVGPHRRAEHAQRSAVTPARRESLTCRDACIGRGQTERPGPRGGRSAEGQPVAAQQQRSHGDRKEQRDPDCGRHTCEPGELVGVGVGGSSYATSATLRRQLEDGPRRRHQ